MRPAEKHGVRTLYRGTWFRSRTEARWASMFDQCGWQWVYEPLDGHGYQPDFVLLGAMPVAVEVKADMTRDELMAHVPKITDGLRGIWRHDVLIVGGAPHGIVNSPTWGNPPCIGLLGEYFAEAGEDDPENMWWFDSAPWWTCWGCPRNNFQCGRPTFNHEFGSYTGRICGHHWGGHAGKDMPMWRLDDMWAQACNVTQWKAS